MAVSEEHIEAAFTQIIMPGRLADVAIGMPGVIALNRFVDWTATDLVASHRASERSARRQAVAGDMFDPKRTRCPLYVVTVAVCFPGGLELGRIHISTIARTSEDLELVGGIWI